jgi:hypothetical protein
MNKTSTVWIYLYAKKDYRIVEGTKLNNTFNKSKFRTPVLLNFFDLHFKHE